MPHAPAANGPDDTARHDPAQDRIAFDYLNVRPGVFRAMPKAPLTPGEYGFIYSVSGGAAGAAASRVFDFTVL